MSDFYFCRARPDLCVAIEDSNTVRLVGRAAQGLKRALTPEPSAALDNPPFRQPSLGAKRKAKGCHAGVKEADFSR